jgi:acyl-coenzyme A thioesterase PaaI-like protein
MTEGRNFDAERFCRRFLNDGHNGLMGIRYTASGEDWADLAMDVMPQHLGINGRIADGAVITLADMSATVAVWIRLGRLIPHATIDLRFDSFAAFPTDGIVIAHARCRPIRDDVACVDGDAQTPDGTRFAQFAASYKLLAT